MKNLVSIWLYLKQIKLMNNIKNIIKNIITFFLSVRVYFIAKKINKNSKNIFIDLGTNKGQGFKYFSKFFKLEFFDYILVEPNPNLKKDIEYLINENEYKNKITFLNKAAHTKDSHKTLFGLVEDTRGIKSEGASILETHNSKLYSTNLNEGLKVKTFNLIDTLKKLKDYENIVIKMDVEGSEYDILEKLNENIRDIKNITHIFIEFHTRFFSNQHKKEFIIREKMIKKNLKSNKVNFSNWV